jgi:chromosome segregation ATPase
MLHRLYGDYDAICTTWEEHLTDLQEKLSGLDEARRHLSELETDLEVHRHSVIMAEMHEEGRINGSNAAKRKRQTELLLAELPEIDPDYGAMLTTADKLRLKIDALDLDIQMLHKRISALRNQARMISGLAFALGG